MPKAPESGALKICIGDITLYRVFFGKEEMGRFGNSDIDAIMASITPNRYARRFSGVKENVVYL
ncbi:hypothetical protein [Arthrospiribacter ruber]|uniref:Uncharacterized protein n=1 Tax=Arthrospiribacter ruber TaxID=2487934 RepID=A0A951IVF7_9BACT|nr:hypothetical protein [Arthrospiribacter ruber]MBW3466934.1 hypothetical protein [Arthrospiribacter ruber]